MRDTYYQIIKLYIPVCKSENIIPFTGTAVASATEMTER